MKNTIGKISSLLLLVSLLIGATSCNDWFSTEPQSEMVAEDFWQDKNDVESALAACYRAMIEGSFVERLIVWGEARSENVMKGPNCNASSDLDLVLSADLNAKNSYTQWSPFYTCINLCNILIQKAPEVYNNDPNFSETELKAYLAEAKTIRAFCYFTLVRTFNSVPFVTEPYIDDSRSYLVAQSSAETILTTLLEDLQGVEYDARPLFENNVIYTKGRVTQKAIWALMADMYLWLNNYGKCVEYCDKVLSTSSNPLELVPNTGVAESHFYRLYRGNSTEGIWELQFDNNNNNNTVLNFYGNLNGQSLESQLNSNKTALEGRFISLTDERWINSHWDYSGSYRVMKYVAYRNTANVSGLNLSNVVYYGSIFNWILYRLPDIYLMKAEALAEIGDAGSLEQAVNLVSYTYDRANEDNVGSLIGNYTTQDAVRDLVFDERQREFLFEGKRYFDFVRRIRREGQAGITSLINKYLVNKYTGEDATTVLTKLNDMDAIYMPINEMELRLNTLLIQNRFYNVSSDMSK